MILMRLSVRADKTQRVLHLLEPTPSVGTLVHVPWAVRRLTVTWSYATSYPRTSACS